jgi:hypothetical protein
MPLGCLMTVASFISSATTHCVNAPGSASSISALGRIGGWKQLAPLWRGRAAKERRGSCGTLLKPAAQISLVAFSGVTTGKVQFVTLNLALLHTQNSGEPWIGSINGWELSHSR